MLNRNDNNNNEFCLFPGIALKMMVKEDKEWNVSHIPIKRRIRNNFVDDVGEE